MPGWPVHHCLHCLVAAGLVTQFYLAVLSKRAFTMVTYGDLPPFESACDAPYINYTHPEKLPDDVLGPAKTMWSGMAMCLLLKPASTSLLADSLGI